MIGIESDSVISDLVRVLWSRITEQYLDDSEKSGRLGYVSTIAWVTKDLFFVSPTVFKPSAQLSAKTPSLLSLSCVCLCPAVSRVGVCGCVCWLESVKDQNREGSKLPRGEFMLK